MATTYTTLIYRVARNLGYTDSSGNVLSGKDLSEDDIKDIINEIYIEQIYPVVADIVPEDFEVTSRANFYNNSGAVDASSTSTTLVATTNIFTSNMVGYTVYNETDGDTREITAYTSATEVTVDSAIDDDWDGDQIYILGTTFGLGGDIADARYIRRVGVKYNTTDDNYTVCKYISRKSAFETGSETYSESAPIYFITTVKQADGTLVNAISIFPENDIAIDNGIEIVYIEEPASLSGATDTQRLPGSTATVYGATAYCARVIGQPHQDWEALFDRELSKLLKTYPKARRNGSALKPPALLNTLRRRTR